MLTETLEAFDSRLHSLMQIMLQEGVSYAARGFSSMIGQSLKISEPHVQLVALDDLPSLCGGPESEAVGIYLRVQGALSGQMMLVLTCAKALELTDLMFGEKLGTTQQLGLMERSALAELGNLTGSCFLNALAKYSGLQTRPSPPAVIVDMLGAILDVVIASHGSIGRYVLMLRTSFLGDSRNVAADFWVIPDPGVLEILAAIPEGTQAG